MADQTAAGSASDNHFNTVDYDYIDEEEAKDVYLQNQGLGEWIARGVSTVMERMRPATEEPISPERTPSRGSIKLTTQPQATVSRQKTGKVNKLSGPRVNSEVPTCFLKSV